jgi:hypothetical protein
MMRGASLRSVADLLGHTSMKMTMRYAHLSPAFLSAEVSLLDPPKPRSPDKPPSPDNLPLSDKPPSPAKPELPAESTSATTAPSLRVEKGERATLAGDNGIKVKRATRAPVAVETSKNTKRARKGQSESLESESRSEVPDFVREIGSSGWTRTSNPPVNSWSSPSEQVSYRVGLSS